MGIHPGMRFIAALLVLALAETGASAQSLPNGTKLVSPFITEMVVSVTTTTYAAAQTDRFMCVVPPSAPVTITLAASPPTGLIQTVNDCTGVFGTYPVTVQAASGQIMGYTNVLMNQSNMSIDFEYTGTQWVMR